VRNAHLMRNPARIPCILLCIFHALYSRSKRSPHAHAARISRTGMRYAHQRMLLLATSALSNIVSIEGISKVAPSEFENIRRTVCRLAQGTSCPLSLHLHLFRSNINIICTKVLFFCRVDVLSLNIWREAIISWFETTPMFNSIIIL
jgi:hypothetical protein